jgi:polar amino acid transport system substrate-binding protein
MLQQKKIDAIVSESAVAQTYIKQNEGLKIIDPNWKQLNSENVILVPKNSPQLLKIINNSIEQIKKTDQIKNSLTAAAQLSAIKESFSDKYLGYFIHGTINTIILAVLGVFGGVAGGIAFALMKLGKNPITRFIANAYIEFVRGTPLMVQIFMVYFGTQAIGINLNAFAAGAIALALNSMAYVAEIIRTGINNVDTGQTEAAQSLGLSESQFMQKIILPQAVKNIIPALGNEFISVIKESSTVMVIGVGELMFNTSTVQGASFRPFLPLLIASAIYFVLTFGLSRLLNFVESKA